MPILFEPVSILSTYSLVNFFDILSPSRHRFRKGGIRHFLQAKTLLITKHPYDILKIVYSVCNTTSNNMVANRKMDSAETPCILLNHQYKCYTFFADMLLDKHAQFIQRNTLGKYIY